MGEAEICRLVEARKDGTDGGEAEAAAAAAAAEAQAAVEHMLALTSCPPGTAVVCPARRTKKGEGSAIPTNLIPCDLR